MIPEGFFWTDLVQIIYGKFYLFTQSRGNPFHSTDSAFVRGKQADRVDRADRFSDRESYFQPGL